MTWSDQLWNNRSQLPLLDGMVTQRVGKLGLRATGRVLLEAVLLESVELLAHLVVEELTAKSVVEEETDSKHNSWNQPLVHHRTIKSDAVAMIHQEQHRAVELYLVQFGVQNSQIPTFPPRRVGCRCLHREQQEVETSKIKRLHSFHETDFLVLQYC